jgi:hypothetical protein
VGVGKNLGENNKGTDQTVIGTSQPASRLILKNGGITDLAK